MKKILHYAAIAATSAAAVMLVSCSSSNKGDDDGGDKLLIEASNVVGDNLSDIKTVKVITTWPSNKEMAGVPFANGGFRVEIPEPDETVLTKIGNLFMDSTEPIAISDETAKLISFEFFAKGQRK